MALTPNVVNTWTKAITGTGASGTNGYIYGTSNIQITNKPGNWLFGIVQWDETNVDPDTMVWLADDAHNYWQHVKLSAAGHTLRTAVLVVADAVATPKPDGTVNPGLTSVYLSSTGFIRNAILTIIEVSGMQPDYVVDIAVPGFASSTSLTISGTTTRADFVLAACTHRFASGSIAITGAGWNTIAQTASNSTDTNVLGMQGASAWQYMSAAGSPSITFTGDNHDWSGVLIAVTARGKWSFTTNGTPVDNTYFIATNAQAALLTVGDVLTDTLNPTQKFTITAIGAPFAGFNNISVTPNAGTIMASPDVVTQFGLTLNTSNPAWPVITCQAAFGVLPGAVTDQYGWTDITSRFLGIKGSRGKGYELDQLEAGDFTISLDNHDGGLNPFNASGPYYPNVKLITPIRLLLSWQGRPTRVFEGQIEFLPANYEEQFGVIQAECSDVFAKLPQVRLQSAMCQEIMYDNPQFYWPLLDPSGSLFASNLSGNTFTTLERVSSKFGNGSGVSDFGATATPSLKGDQSTVFQQTGVAFGTPWKGWALRCLDDSLPALSGPTAWEWWFNLATTGNTNPGTMLTIEGAANASGGVTIQVNDAAGAIQVQWFDSSQVLQSLSTTLGSNFEDGQWHHYYLATTSTTIKLYIDGVLTLQNNATSFINSNVESVEMFGVTNRFVNNQTPTFINGAATQLAVYNYNLEIERIQEHFNSGAGGFANEDTGQRVMRLLRYADWAKPQAVDSGISLAQRLDYMGSGLGYGSGGIASSFGLFGSFGKQTQTNAAGASGTQADLAVQDQALTENGLVFVDRNGCLFFKNRDNLYNGGVRANFSDGFFQLNKNSRFADLSNWTVSNTGNPLAQGGAIWKLGGAPGSLLWTADGVGVNPVVKSESTIPVNPNTSYQFDTWMMSPQGFSTGQIGIQWFQSNGTFITSIASPTFTLNPITPIPVSFKATSPSNAAFGMIFAQGLGTPAAGTQFIISKPTLSASGFAVPFMDDIIIGFDVTFLYNDVQVTRNVDQAFSRVVDLTSKTEYFTRTYSRTIYSPGTSDTTDVTDNANWVLNAYREPKYRIESMNVDVGSNPDAWEVVSRLDVGDIVAFSRTAPGTVPVTAFFVVLKIEPTIGQDIATFAYSFGPILNPVLTLDDPVTGIIGSSVIGF